MFGILQVFHSSVIIMLITVKSTHNNNLIKKVLIVQKPIIFDNSFCKDAFHTYKETNIKLSFQHVLQFLKSTLW